MKKKHVLFITFFIFGVLFALPHAWINEIHYDNAGADKNEFVEVVVENPENYYLGDLCLYMYNGYDGVQYCLDTIDEFEVGDREGNFQFYTWYQKGIQNDMEGMILVYCDTLVDIIAYEGSFTGMNEPAEGEEFPDIGIHESGSGPDTCSIYLLGMPGSNWEDGPSTPGSLNNNQELSESPTPVELIDFNAVYHNNSVHINWQTESETEVIRYNIYKNGILLTWQNASGSSSEPNDYDYIDRNIGFKDKLTYIISETSRNMAENMLDTVKLTIPHRKALSVKAPFPNPTNPEFNISINTVEAGQLSIALYNLKGQKIRDIANLCVNSGNHLFNVETSGITSGQYVIRSRFNGMSDSKTVSILK